jgi:hypothetical protein
MVLEIWESACELDRITGVRNDIVPYGMNEQKIKYMRNESRIYLGIRILSI